jgi:hypothetical protein
VTWRYSLQRRVTVPAPPKNELFSAQMRPPCASTMDLEMIKPMLIPVFFVVSIRSKRRPGAPFGNSEARAPDWTAMARPILPSRSLLLR